MDKSNGLMYGVAAVKFKAAGAEGQEKHWAGWMKTGCSRQETHLPLWILWLHR